MADATVERADAPAGNMRQRVVKVLRMTAAPLMWAVALFAGAGRFDWARAWVCLGLYVVGMAGIGVVVGRVNRGLMAAREKRGSNTKHFDKVFLRILLPLTFVQPAVGGLDAARFGWSSMPLSLFYAGAVMFIVAMVLIGWPMSVNPFAETTVRIQTDRGHKVVATGPYRAVRHPMYVGSILMYVATGLILGSVWALIAGGVMAGLFIWRTAMEDRTLRRELPGYEEYAASTRYRLLPGLW